MVYNFEVADHHNYFVSNDGYLVHNACGGGENGGYSRGGQKLEPHPNANGSGHSSFKTDKNGLITSYETYTPQTNPKNPNPYEKIRFDGNHSHNGMQPHVHDLKAPNKVRSPEPYELPRGY